MPSLRPAEVGSLPIAACQTQAGGSRHAG